MLQFSIPVMEVNYLHLPHFGARHGANEQQTESYTWYDEGVAELATQSCTKNASRVGGSADKQAGMVRRV